MPPKKRTYSKSVETEKIINKPKSTKAKSTVEKIVKRQHTEASYTLYLSNLNTNIKPTKIKENLYILFSSFADILEINYPRKSYRGQGWIVVTSQDDATECISKLQDFNFFEQPLRIKYAKKESKIINILNSRLENSENINKSTETS